MLISAGSSLDLRLVAPLAAATGLFLAIAAWRWATQRRGTARDVTREQRARLRDQVAIRDSLEALLARLGEAARDADQRFERQSAQLESLLRSADERIARLAADPAAASVPTEPRPPRPATSGAADQGGEPPQGAVNVEQPAPPDRAGLRDAVERLRRRLRSRPAAAPLDAAPVSVPQTCVAGVDSAFGAAQGGASKLLLTDPRFQPVYDLADSGRSPVQIAEALALLPGEVELILNLRALT